MRSRLRLKRPILGVGMGVAALALASCRGVVTDPVGDYSSSPGSSIDPVVDLFEAGVDYQTDSTTLWVKMESNVFAPPRWSISTNDDTSAEYTVQISIRYVEGQQRVFYSVRAVGGGALACEGDITTAREPRLTFDSTCLAGAGPQPGGVRVSADAQSAYSHDQGQAYDSTDWTKWVPISEPPTTSQP